MLDFIERLRAKPEHVRKRIAVGTATAITGVVTLGWLGALVAGNAFILKPGETGASLADTASQLTGAVANAPSLSGTNKNTADPSSLIIVESESSSTIEDSGPSVVDDRRVIPF